MDWASYYYLKKKLYANTDSNLSHLSKISTLINAMCNLILQNPLARGKRGRGKGKRGIFRLAHHIALLKVAHGVNGELVKGNW